MSGCAAYASKLLLGKVKAGEHPTPPSGPSGVSPAPSDSDAYLASLASAAVKAKAQRGNENPDEWANRLADDYFSDGDQLKSALAASRAEVERLTKELEVWVAGFGEHEVALGATQRTLVESERKREAAEKERDEAKGKLVLARAMTQSYYDYQAQLLARAKNAEAACAAKDEALRGMKIQHMHNCYRPGTAEEGVRAVLSECHSACVEPKRVAAPSLDAGKDWVSPDEHARAQAETAAMRSAVESMRSMLVGVTDLGWDGVRRMSQVADAALSLDAGKGWVSPDEHENVLVKLRDALASTAGSALLAELAALRASATVLAEVRAWSKSPEVQGSLTYAAIHGYQVSREFSEAADERWASVDAALAAVGKARTR